MHPGGRSPVLIFFILAVIVIATRLCHSNVLWADDNLPLAAAMEVARGKVLYRDVWFDKPPLVAWIDLLWGARAGILLRLAGAAYVIAVAATTWQFARAKWTEREGLFAAFFAAFFLTFGLPSAVIPLASDMLLVLPHLAAVYFAWRGRAFLSGVAAGVGLLCSSKAIFVLAACAVWQWRQLPLLVIGFAAPNAIALGWMWLHGSASEYYRQAWQWGRIYAANTFVEHPFGEGVTRTLNWVGFQAALVVGAIFAFRRERRLAIWIAPLARRSDSRIAILPALLFPAAASDDRRRVTRLGALVKKQNRHSGTLRFTSRSLDQIRQTLHHPSARSYYYRSRDGPR